MLKIITTLTMFIIGLLANAQVSETRAVSEFSKIEITDGVELILTTGDKTDITAEAANSSVLASLSTISKKGTLKITTKSNEPVTIYVAAAGITSIKASHRSMVRAISPLSGDEMKIELASGAGFNGTILAENISLKGNSESIFNVNVKTGTLAGNFGGKSKVNLSGTANAAALHSEAGVLCNARNFVAWNLSVNAEGKSAVSVHADNSINVSVADNAKVTYYGTPAIVALTPDATASRTITRSGSLTQN